MCVNRMHVLAMPISAYIGHVGMDAKAVEKKSNIKLEEFQKGVMEGLSVCYHYGSESTARAKDHVKLTSLHLH